VQGPIFKTGDGDAIADGAARAAASDGVCVVGKRHDDGIDQVELLKINKQRQLGGYIDSQSSSIIGVSVGDTKLL
jgi:hypothetical protein